MRSGRPLMPEIEVRATSSFIHRLAPQGRFLRARRYQVDDDDQDVQALIKGGYFVAVNKLEVTRVVGVVGADEFLGSGLGTRRSRPKKKDAGEPESEVDDGQGEPVQATD